MVISEDPSEEDRPKKSLIMLCRRSRPLHNFVLPSLKWGNPRLLECKLPPKEGIQTQSQSDVEIDKSEQKKQLSPNGGSGKLKNMVVEEKGEEAAVVTAAMPWNLRTRRAACKDPKERWRLEERLGDGGEGRDKERRKFSTSLSREEIEDDFFFMTDSKPSRRPKKRPRIMQKQLDELYPGLWLCEITADRYKVRDDVGTR